MACIRGKTSQWIESFLSNRTQCSFREFKSSSVAVSSDVPQGINDLPDSICHNTLMLFADNCLLYKTIKSSQDAVALQQDLLAMQTWENTWLMQFKISKCFLIRVTQSTKYKVIAT